MRVLVCGGRNFANPLPKDDPLHMKKQHEWIFVMMTLSELLGKKDDLILITGSAKGVVQMAANWAQNHGIRNEKYPADWKKHGKAAGPIRNKQMLEEGKPDWVIAFPGGNGTEHMCSIAERAGVKVKRIRYDGVLTIPFESSTSGHIGPQSLDE